MTAPNDNLTIAKSDSWKMFDEISPRYDFLNRLLSFGLDAVWRRQLGRFLPDVAGTDRDLSLLDLATGTADVLLTLVRRNRNIQEAAGIDLSDKMLALGRAKIARANLSGRITLKHGDACCIPFEGNRFNAVTMAFGIRNVEDPSRVLNEMRRVLRPGGMAVVLELSLPQNKILRVAHLFYLRTVLPAIGGLVSGHAGAYRYLNRTIEAFPSGEDFCRLMRQTGFGAVGANPLCAGIATIYTGEK